jgi:polyphenol oxidase
VTPEFIVPEWPAPTRVRALVTTRQGGVSSGECSSLNLGLHVGDEIAAVIENRRRLSAALPGEPLWLNQVHGAGVVQADLAVQGAAADASLTRVPNTVCAVMTADCLPVLLCDETASVVAAVHAGWRGLAAGVIENTLDAMACPAARLLAYLGPAIGAASFEVGDEVRAAFVDRDPEAAAAFAARSPGKWLSDLYGLARMRLVAQGVSRIFGGGFDTFADPQRFFSYRRSPQSGRMASLIWLDS